MMILYQHSFLNDTAFLAPFIFLELIACNGSSSVDVTATPTISNTIPMAINNTNIIIPTNRFTFWHYGIRTKKKR